MTAVSDHVLVYEPLASIQVPPRPYSVVPSRLFTIISSNLFISPSLLWEPLVFAPFTCVHGAFRSSGGGVGIGSLRKAMACTQTIVLRPPGQTFLANVRLSSFQSFGLQIIAMMRCYAILQRWNHWDFHCDTCDVYVLLFFQIKSPHSPLLARQKISY